jgi:electron transport complex protein RnfC
VGVVVNNVGTLALIGKLLPESEGLIERVVTFAGPGIKKPGNYIVPLGTPLRFALDYVGYTGDAGHIILGGPMMGNTVASLDVPTTKGVTGVVVLDKAVDEKAPIKVSPCIRCGRCLEACPVKLNPSQMGRLAAKGQYDVMQEKFHLNDCFECGSCSYVCPSNIPLVQYFRIAKSINRDRAA